MPVCGCGRRGASWRQLLGSDGFVAAGRQRQLRRLARGLGGRSGGGFGGIARLQLAPEPSEVGIVDAVGGQPQQGLLQVFACRAEQARGVAQPFHHAGVRQPAGVGLVRTVHDEGQRALLRRAGGADADAQPARMVGAGQHFAAPQHAELLLDHMAGHAEHHAVAAAAAVEPEHQSGIVPGAPVDAGIEVEAAVVAVHRGALALGVHHHRVPDQRAVAEYPHIAAERAIVGAARQRIGQRLLQRRFGQQRGRNRGAAQRGAQPVGFEVLSRDAHAASINQSSVPGGAGKCHKWHFCSELSESALRVWAPDNGSGRVPSLPLAMTVRRGALSAIRPARIARRWRRRVLTMGPQSNPGGTCDGTYAYGGIRQRQGI
ncbi:protein of unknown function [Cupriavidus taiwanensis]|uniref:Uncharacterized protein n=1 Tax=Cupriavidus taiwanensis TaxID=164546 RepID=A0A375GWS5_9BURK|nr:hypothetical protein CBM2592_A190104 [Cupriavidus taiwanensis]SPD44011.1 protein of unknown function [Cupriavidus taiwanensis]SPK71472.1 protein of unknown function [Cupriavidus taiwanensis]